MVVPTCNSRLSAFVISLVDFRTGAAASLGNDELPFAGVGLLDGESDIF